MKEVLTYLTEKNTLDTVQARKVFTEIAMGKYSDAEVAAFITVYLMRPITGAELTGFRQALLDLSVRLDFSEFNTKTSSPFNTDLTTKLPSLPN